MKKWRSWACGNFKVSEEDPSFCANCGDFASMHKGPTPGAVRSFRLHLQTNPTTPGDGAAVHRAAIDAARQTQR